jgi:hypothetical protein
MLLSVGNIQLRGWRSCGFRTRSVHVAVRAEGHVIQIGLILASAREVRHTAGQGAQTAASSDGESGRLPRPGSGGAWWAARLSRAQPT